MRLYKLRYVKYPFPPISHGVNSFVVARKECGRGNDLERLDALEK